jgi:hypothetical protein
MPHRTGASHAAASFVALVAGSYLKDVLKLYVDATDLVSVIRDVAGTVVGHPAVAVTPETASLTLAAVAVGVLAFVWGVAYHLRSIEG